METAAGVPRREKADITVLVGGWEGLGVVGSWKVGRCGVEGLAIDGGRFVYNFSVPSWQQVAFGPGGEYGV